MANLSRRERLKAFLLRRKLNAFGLLAITAGSLIATLIAGLCGFAHTDLLALVALMMVALCFVQGYRMRASFRTMRAFRGFRKKKKH